MQEEILRTEYRDEIRNIVSIIGVPAGNFNLLLAMLISRKVRKLAVKSKLKKITAVIGQNIELVVK